MMRRLGLSYMMEFGDKFTVNSGIKLSFLIRFRTFTIEMCFPSSSNQFGSRDIGLPPMIWQINPKKKLSKLTKPIIHRKYSTSLSLKSTISQRTTKHFTTKSSTSFNKNMNSSLPILETNLSSMKTCIYTTTMNRLETQTNLILRSFYSLTISIYSNTFLTTRK